MKKPSRKFVRVAALSLLAATTWIGALVVHSVVANMHYRLNYVRLQMAADIAVKAGAMYLPADPGAAVRVADAYAGLNGVLPAEIVFTKVAPDRHTLWIRLDYKMPTYVALFAVGLPSREIAVTASAQSISNARHGGVEASVKGSPGKRAGLRRLAVSRRESIGWWS